MNRSTLSVVVASGLALAAPAAAQFTSQDDGPTAAQINATVPAGSLNGMTAVRSLGDDLERVAGEYGMTPEQLATRFSTDLSLYVTPEGWLLNVCAAAPAEFADQNPEDNGTPALAAIFDEDIPLDDFLDLETMPGADKTVYLDFDGFFSSGNRWGHSINFPAYDTSGNPAVFTDQEKSDIIEHWKEVAEDMAQFEVNVTTKDPGTAALIRSNGGDSRFGIRVVMTQPTSGFGNGIGGVAYLNSFNDSQDNPCFAFNKGLGAGPMTASHEAGHTFNLQHDGLNGSTYHPGSNSSGTTWGPIMGAPFGRELVQWSRGDYTGSTSTQIDFNVITGSNNDIDFIADDHPGSTTTGTPIAIDVPADGVINSQSDLDSFRINIPTAGDYIISVENARRGPNLDALFTVYRASPNNFIGITSIDGSGDAEDLYTLAAGDYVIVVDGTFEPIPNGPDTDYGSVGAFQVLVTEFVPPQPVTFNFPNGLPTDLTEGQPTTLTVEIDPGDEGPLNPGSAILFYQYDVQGQPGNFAPLVNTSGNIYEAAIPAGDCGQVASFYFNISNTSVNPLINYSSPSDPTMPYTAEVTDCEPDDCLADVNGDGSADPADFNAWIIAFNNQLPSCDQNSDGLCTAADFNAWILNFNAGC